MKLIGAEIAWADYLYWQQENPEIGRKINELIKDIRRNPFQESSDAQEIIITGSRIKAPNLTARC